MKHRIDPKVDCVFQALLGAEENRDLLIHFINAILVEELKAPITRAEIQGPYDEGASSDDQLSKVDVEARDDLGQTHRIEIHLWTRGGMPPQIVYTWTRIFSQRLASNLDFLNIKPVYSIWLLAERAVQDEDTTRYAYDFKLRNENGDAFLPEGGICVLELSKLPIGDVASERERWLKLFAEGASLDDEALPDWMNTDEMRRAMGVLRGFSENADAYQAYQARMSHLREQRAIRDQAPTQNALGT